MNADLIKTNNRHARRAARKGLTLIEAAMVLTILALVVGGVMLFYSNANQSRLTSSVAGQLGSIQNAVRGVYGGQSSYLSLTNSDITSSLPSSMTNASDPTAIQHAFNGKVTIAPADAGGGDGSGFSVSLVGVPQQACIKLVAMDMGRSVTGIGSSVMSSPGTEVGTSIPPLSPTGAKALCGTGTNSSISWLFY